MSEWQESLIPSRRNLFAMAAGACMGSLVLVMLAWLWFVIYFLAVPLEVIPGDDAVMPERVRAGDVVTIRRSFRITRFAQLNVHRVMIKGDCNANCELLDLVDGTIILPVGEYRTIDRVQVIPAAASPGKWLIVFTVSQEIMGFRAHMTLPILNLEVIE